MTPLRPSPLAVISLAGPGDPGTLTEDAVARLHGALDDALAGTPRAVVLRGTPEVFCAGLDLGAAPVGDAAAIGRFVALVERLTDLPVPVIAVVEGAVRGGGMAFVAVADIVLATPESSWQMPELHVGLVPGIVGALLVPARLSAARLRYLVQSGTTLDGAAALATGLVDEVHAAHALPGRLASLGRQVRRASPEATRRFRRLCQAWWEGDTPRRLLLGRAELEGMRRHGDHAAARAARAEGCMPEFDPPGAEVPEAGGMATPVQYDVPEPGVAVVTMADPLSRNALTPAMLAGLRAAFARAAADPTIGVCVLQGLPDVFCSGATQETLLGALDGHVDLSEVELAQVVLGAPMPVIGCAEGHAVGGGVILLAACDVVVLAREARVSASFATLGITPGMGSTALLGDLVGPSLAREMLYTGRAVRGLDLILPGSRGPHVLSRAEVAGHARTLARRMAMVDAPVARGVKTLLSVPRRRAVHDALGMERAQHRGIFDDPATRSRLEAALGAPA